ncbi:BlpM [Streptococcus pneumoniae]|nr:BlpM [Streptococcus pneumoniae]
MDTKIMEQFHEMDITMLSSIEGGKNNWQTNVLEGGGAAFGGWGLGTAICAASGVGAPFMGACGYIGLWIFSLYRYIIKMKAKFYEGYILYYSLRFSNLSYLSIHKYLR